MCANSSPYYPNAFTYFFYSIRNNHFINDTGRCFNFIWKPMQNIISYWRLK